MKSNLKNQIKSLLSGSEKQDILVASMKTEGIYEVGDKKYNLLEFEELKKNYTNSIVFTLAKNNKTDNKSASNKNHLTIQVNNLKTADTYLKLRGLKE